MYYKLYAIELIEDNIDRLLAIDADTIINGSLEELYNIDLKGNTLGMVQDFMPYSYMKKIGMRDYETYYNSGIVLFDVDRWIARSCHDRIETFLRGNLEHILYADQDAISIVLQTEIKKLPIIYNYYTVFSALSEFMSVNLETIYKLYDLQKLYNFYPAHEMYSAETNAVVYHYEGGTVVGRPWEKGGNYKIFDIWENYKNDSPWENIEKFINKGPLFHNIEKKLNKILPRNVFIKIYKFAYDLYWRHILSIKPNN